VLGKKIPQCENIGGITNKRQCDPIDTDFEAYF